MSNPLLLLAPTVNMLVTGLFAAVVLRQYLNRHRIYQLYWSIALSMAFIATLAYIFMLIAQPTSAIGTLLFRIYYTFGGAVMPAWLGLGSIALMGHERITRICFDVLCILSVLVAALIFTASLDQQHLAHIAGTPGAGILQSGAAITILVILNTLGLLAVAGGAAYSGWRLLRRQTSMGGLRIQRAVWANGCILIGAVLNGTAGSLAFLRIQSTFWFIMALGWIVLFAGVLLASRRSSAVQQTVSVEQGVKHSVGG